MRLSLTSKRALTISRLWAYATAHAFSRVQKKLDAGGTSITVELIRRTYVPLAGTAVAHNCTPNNLGKLSPELLSIIMNQIRTKNLLAFSYTSKLHRTAVMAEYLSRTSILLTHFQLPALSFLGILHRTRSLIGGSVPFHVLANDLFTPNNLDIYTPASQGETFLALLRTKTYFRIHSGPTVQVLDPTIQHVYRLEANGKVMNLRILHGENAALAIFFAPTTCLMNFISSWGVYCGNPNLTLCLRGLEIVPRFIGPINEQDFIAKYAHRGVAHQQFINSWPEYKFHECRRSPICPQTTRDIYDTMGLFIRFPTRSTVAPGIPDNLRYDHKHTVVWNVGACGREGVQTRAFAQSQFLANGHSYTM